MHTVPTSYEETLKPSSSASIIIPTSVLERDVDKYNQNNNNNNNSISNLSIGNNTSTNTALKIEEVSNETSNLMIEDRQNSTTTTVAASTRLGVMRSDLLCMRFKRKIYFSFLAHLLHLRQILREVATVNLLTAMSP